MKKLTILLCALLLAALPSFAEACDSETHAGDHAGDHASACPMKGKKVAESSEVEMTGKVVCMHCDLHKEESCRKVFQSAKDQSIADICPMSDMKSVESVSEDGKALLLVTGKLVKAEDGSMTIEIKSAKKAEKTAS